MRAGKLDEVEHKLILCLVRGDTTEEAAKKIGMSRRGAHSRLIRARQMMDCRSMVELCCTYVIGLMEDERIRLREI